MSSRTPRTSGLALIVALLVTAGCSGSSPSDAAQVETSSSTTTSTVQAPTTTQAATTTSQPPATIAGPPDLGVTPADIETKYTAPLYGFQFEPGEPADGRPQIVGKTTDGTAILQVIGGPSVTTISLVLIKAEDGRFSEGLAIGLIKDIAPAAFDWWFGETQRTHDTSPRFERKFESSKTFDDRRLEITFDYDTGGYVISISAV